MPDHTLKISVTDILNYTKMTREGLAAGHVAMPADALKKLDTSLGSLEQSINSLAAEASILSAPNMGGMFVTIVPPKEVCPTCKRKL